MSDPTRIRDEWLALRCKSGVDRAFEELIAALERPLFYYATKLTSSPDAALDVLQDVWLQAFRGIAKLKDPASVRSWLYCLTRGAAVNRIRKDRARDKAEEIHFESFDETAEPDFTADDAAAVHQALDSIETKHREVLVLHFLEDFSLQETAQILNCPEGTVKSRIHYAKRALKTALLEKTHDQPK